MKKLIVMMLALVFAFSFTACNNDTPPPGNDGSIDVPSPVDAVPDGIFKEVYDLESRVLKAYEDVPTTDREESTVNWFYNADDDLIATAEEGEGTAVVYTVAMDGEHFKAGTKVVREVYDYYYYDSKAPLRSDEVSDFEQLLGSYRRMETSYSLSFSCTSTIDGTNVVFNNKVDVYREFRLVPDSDGITEEDVYTLRHTVALSGYDGLSSYVLYGQMTDPDPMTVVIEVDGTAYSLAKTDNDNLGNALEDSFLYDFLT